MLNAIPRSYLLVVVEPSYRSPQLMAAPSLHPSATKPEGRHQIRPTARRRSAQNSSTVSYMTSVPVEK